MLVSIVLAGLLLWQIPRVQRALEWRMDVAMTYLRMVLNPVSKLPTPMTSSQNLPRVETSPNVVTPSATEPALLVTATPTLIPTPTIKPTPLPESVLLEAPAYDQAKDKIGRAHV